MYKYAYLYKIVHEVGLAPTLFLMYDIYSIGPSLLGNSWLLLKFFLTKYFKLILHKCRWIGIEPTKDIFLQYSYRKISRKLIYLIFNSSAAKATRQILKKYLFFNPTLYTEPTFPIVYIYIFKFNIPRGIRTLTKRILSPSPLPSWAMGT